MRSRGFWATGGGNMPIPGPKNGEKEGKVVSFVWEEVVVMRSHLNGHRRGTPRRYGHRKKNRFFALTIIYVGECSHVVRESKREKRPLLKQKPSPVSFALD